MRKNLKSQVRLPSGEIARSGGLRLSGNPTTGSVFCCRKRPNLREGPSDSDSCKGQRGGGEKRIMGA